MRINYELAIANYGKERKSQHTPKSPLDRGELKRRKEEKMQHTPKSPLDRGDLKRRKEEKKQHTPKSPLDRGELKKKTLVPPLPRGG